MIPASYVQNGPAFLVPGGAIDPGRSFRVARASPALTGAQLQKSSVHTVDLHCPSTQLPTQQFASTMQPEPSEPQMTRGRSPEDDDDDDDEDDEDDDENDPDDDGAVVSLVSVGGIGGTGRSLHRWLSQICEQHSASLLQTPSFERQPRFELLPPFEAGPPTRQSSRGPQAPASPGVDAEAPRPGLRIAL